MQYEEEYDDDDVDDDDHDDDDDNDDGDDDGDLPCDVDTVQSIPASVTLSRLGLAIVIRVGHTIAVVASISVLLVAAVFELPQRCEHSRNREVIFKRQRSNQAMRSTNCHAS